MTAPTAEEEQLLIEFRSRVMEALETENQQSSQFLLRWLRARNHDLRQAENMLRTSLAWRKENRIDCILELPVDSFCENEFPLYYTNGTDKQGQPFYVIPVGIWNYRKCVADNKTEEFKLYINYRFEEICRAIEKQNINRDPSLYPITQFSLVSDWTGFSYMQLCSLKALQSMFYAMVTYEAHYPEILSAALFINCPGFFNIVMRMIKQLVVVRTFEKLKVYGSNRKEWEQACRQLIDENQFNGMLTLLG